ncbi:efflux RND transporter periplasmic adaptor subunit [bacterium]|nr:efflux RND transporter periplasmic adaptor subunit [bacterium]
MKKFTLSAVFLAALAIGVYYFWPAATAGEAESPHDHNEQAQGEYHGDEKMADQAIEGRKPILSKDAHMKENSTEKHSNHEGEGGHGEEVVRLSDEEVKEFEIELVTAESGILEQYIDLPGELVINNDRMVHVVSRVSGIAKEVRKSVGNSVEAGELLAVLESRELAEAKAAYLAAIEREKLATADFEREERLWKKKITSEKEYLDAHQSLAEARIARKSVEQQLHTLGCSEEELRTLPDKSDLAYTHYKLNAPFAGTIIERHLTLGENVSSSNELFIIADLSSVWLDINVYQKDLINIRRGQTVRIEIGHGIPVVTGKIAWVGPIVGETTRTAKARVVLPNPDGNLRPGIFVTARVEVERYEAVVVVLRSALQNFEERTVVFVLTEKGFEPKPVKTGRQSDKYVEILSGVERGQVYVGKGAFTLKAQLSKGAFGDGHNH